MTFELLLIPLIFLLSFMLLVVNFRASVYLLLALSLLLHKELFSIYRWDVLPVRIFMLAFLVYLLAWLSWYLSQNKGIKANISRLLDLARDPFVTLFALLWLVRGISIIFTRNFQASILLFGFFTAVTFWGIYFYLKFKNYPNQLEKYLNFYFILAFLLGVFGFIQVLYLQQTGQVIGALWPVPGHTPRVGSLFWDVNHFGGFLAAVLPVMGVMILTAVSHKRRALYALGFALLTLILLLTNSRTAWMGAFFSFLTFLSILAYIKFRARGIVTLALSVVILVTPFFLEYQDRDSPFRAKVKDYFHYRIDSFDSHLLLIRGSFAVFEKLPILGGGYGGFFEHFSKTDVAAELFGRDPAALNTRVPAHTIWGEALAETGIVGFSSFILLFGFILGVMLHSTLKTQSWKKRLHYAATTSAIVGWLIAGIFYSYNTEFFWIIIVLYFTYVVGSMGNDLKVYELVRSPLENTKLHVAVLIIASSVIFFAQLGTNHLLPWDEAIYAEISQNMLESGDYIVQHWSSLSDPWYEKPPLYMWMAAGVSKALGESVSPELAVRLPSALFGFLTVLLTYLFAKKLHGKLVGFLAALVLLTTFQFIYYSRASMLDVTTTFFITLCLYLYWLAKESLGSKATTYWLLSGVTCGLAVMTKGVVGLLPFGVIGVYELILIATHKQNLTKKLVGSYALLFAASALIFLPWHLAMYARFGTEFVSNYIGYHVLDRAVSAIEDKGRPFYWYFIVLKVSMRVWFVVLLAAFPYSLLRALRSQDKKALFVVSYSLVIFTFFSAATSKLVWYIMPVYPVLAIIVGYFIAVVINKFLAGKQLLKLLAVIGVIIFAFSYLYINKNLIYLSDLTGKQARLLQDKDKFLGTSSLVYVDLIEYPLILYYSDSPFEGVDFATLKEKIEIATPGQHLIFITKESRVRGFQEDHPKIKQIQRYDEWVLAEYQP